ncbi:MAG: hypothetical protein OEV42_17940 [Deltaproteobacteria bacterium]|nr:hypothetical protein [Deltaproteobacteria bacterium]
MKRLISLFAAILFLAPLFAYSSGKLPFQKPSPPLHVEILQAAEEEGAKNNEIIFLSVSVISYIDAEEMSLIISLHGKVTLISGELNWKGPVKKGEVKNFQLSLKAPGKNPGKVSASAFIALSEGTRLSASDSISFNVNRKKAPSPSPLKKDRKGREIQEERL